jgi:ribosomal protein L7/L12
MINVDMTVREAINLIQTLPCDLDGENLRNRLIKAIEIAAGDANTTLTLHSIPENKWVWTIKTIRDGMGWSLMESKDFCRVVRGEGVTTATKTDDYSPWGEATHYETHYEGGKPNTLSASSKAINDMVIRLRELGCTVTTG